MEEGTTSVDVHKQPERDNTIADATGETTGENDRLSVVIPGIVLAENESNEIRRTKGSAKLGGQPRGKKKPKSSKKPQ